ncbi:MAG TPA: hypothetical protein VHB51_00605 [Candidatus Saccharimonadales bacterium]|nr:hypothetical protein [Candidatus Saccharimonadales bacterium]
MLASRRPGVRTNASGVTVFDPLLIDNFSRPNGTLGTAYNGQLWSAVWGSPVINFGRFTSGTASNSAANITTTGTIGDLCFSVDCDPGPSSLGDQDYMVIGLFSDPNTSERYVFQISQRNWFVIYCSPTDSQSSLASGSPGYTYSTPFRLYITAKYIGTSVYIGVETSNLTGGPHTVITQGTYPTQVANGSKLQLWCWGSQYFDNLRNVTPFVPPTVTLPFSDNFNRADGSAGSPWYTTPAIAPGLPIVSNTLQYAGVSSVLALKLPSQNIDVTFTAHYAPSTGARDDLQFAFFRNDYLAGENIYYLWATNPDVGSGGSTGVALYKVTNGSPALLSFTSGYLTENTTYTMRVVASGTSVSAYVNGVVKNSTTLPSIPSGQTAVDFIINKPGSYIDDVSFA